MLAHYAWKKYEEDISGNCAQSEEYVTKPERMIGHKKQEYEREGNDVFDQRLYLSMHAEQL